MAFNPRNFMPLRDVADSESMLSPSIVVRPAVPLHFSRGAAAPIVGLTAIFTVFGMEVGLPFVLSAIFGGLGCVTSLLFHELGHVRAASAVPSVRPTSVSFMWAGAATNLEGRYRSGRDQMRVAIGGPKASFALAFALFCVCLLPAPLPVKEPLILLAFFNIALGLLNLFPFYPLDGYKVVAGLLWAVTGSESKARRILRRIGIGWAALEAPAALVLLVEKPLIGTIALTAGLTLFAQKRLVNRAAH
jgi:Zn-dependent protease